MNPDFEHVTSYICMTKDIGVGGNLFGGVMMAWIDEASGIFAHRFTGHVRMVTVRYSELVFKVPVKVGDLVDFYAGNGSVGRTSVTFDIEGRVGSDVVVHTTAAFVAVDKGGRPVKIGG